MTGKELFEAMEYVDDELVNEAEEKAWSGKKYTFPAKQWYGVAAVFCVLVISITAITLYTRQGGYGETSGGAGEVTNDMAAYEDAPEAAADEEVGDVAMEESATADVEEDAMSTQKQNTVEDTAGHQENAGVAENIQIPEAGSCVYGPSVAEVLQEYEGQDVRFLLRFELYSEGSLVAWDSAGYQKECERLQALGLDLTNVFCWIYDENGERKDLTITAGIFTAKELKSFPANEDYSYRFVFVTNGDGSHVSYSRDVITGPK